METKTDITAILKDKLKGTKLYSTVHGNCNFVSLGNEVFQIKFCTSKFGVTQSGECTLIKFGNMFDDGECVVFPSKEMRDWSKFAWKKGDVLIKTNSEYCVGIFDKWTSDDYSTFSAKYINLGLSDNFSCSHTCKTEEWEKMKNSKNYISKIERVMNGKLNLKTLEIEKQPEFKDGDVITIIPHIGDKLIYLFKAEDDEKYYGHAFLDGNIAIVNEDSYCQKDFCTACLSTDEEKQQLFKALAKNGKVWIPEKKQIVDLKPKWTLKPFDKVLVRDSKASKWRANLFSHKNIDEPYYCVYAGWNYCIPYEGNEHLLGTTKDVEE